MLQQRFFTKVYPTCLMYSVRALCWLCRHKSYLLLWVISGKTSQCLLGEVKCQFLSETLSERASWFVLLAQRLSSVCLSWISSPLKNTHKTCIFCTCILAPSRRQTRSSRIIFWPSWNPGYIQQKCTSCWQTFLIFFYSWTVPCLQTGSKSTPKTLLTTLQSSPTVWYTQCSHSGVKWEKLWLDSVNMPSCFPPSGSSEHWRTPHILLPSCPLTVLPLPFCTPVYPSQWLWPLQE